ncbi:hypothetical protein Q7P37_008115 [Cladosporium fusiforme]
MAPQSSKAGELGSSSRPVYAQDPRTDEIVLGDGRRFARPPNVPRIGLEAVSYRGSHPPPSPPTLSSGYSYMTFEDRYIHSGAGSSSVSTQPRELLRVGMWPNFRTEQPQDRQTSHGPVEEYEDEEDDDDEEESDEESDEDGSDEDEIDEIDSGDEVTDKDEADEDKVEETQNDGNDGSVTNEDLALVGALEQLDITQDEDPGLDEDGEGNATGSSQEQSSTAQSNPASSGESANSTEQGGNHRHKRRRSDGGNEGGGDGDRSRQPGRRTTGVARQEQPVSCFVDTCDRKVAHLSELIRHLQSTHHFYFCQRCFIVYDMKESLDEHDRQGCRLHCINERCEERDDVLGFDEVLGLLHKASKSCCPRKRQEGPRSDLRFIEHLYASKKASQSFGTEETITYSNEELPSSSMKGKQPLSKANDACYRCQQQMESMDLMRRQAKTEKIILGKCVRAYSDWSVGLMNPDLEELLEANAPEMINMFHEKQSCKFWEAVRTLNSMTLGPPVDPDPIAPPSTKGESISSGEPNGSNQTFEHISKELASEAMGSANDLLPNMEFYGSQPLSLDTANDRLPLMERPMQPDRQASEILFHDANEFTCGGLSDGWEQFVAPQQTAEVPRRFEMGKGVLSSKSSDLEQITGFGQSPNMDPVVHSLFGL